jgi:hypothetical protein
MNKWEKSRRDLLKGLGVGLGCLPLLKAGYVKAATGSTNKMIVVMLTEGYVQGAWKPNAGPLTSLPMSCTGLQPHINDVVFLPNLDNPFYPDAAGNHGHGAYGTIFYGQTARDTGEYREPNGATIDQIVAGGLPKSAAGRPTLPLQVQVDRPPTSGGPGSSRCFWKGASQPINPEPDPVATYKEIFMGGAVDAPMGADDATVKKNLLQKKSLLDYVGKSLEKFGKRLGTDDRMAIEGHLASVRELETQLVVPAGGGNSKCGGDMLGMINLDDGQQFPNILQAHFTLIVAALKCGITQVATLQVGDATGKNVNFAFVPGVPAMGTGYKTPFRNWHDLGHNPVLNGVNHKMIVDKWWMDRFADLIGKLKETPDPSGGTLLSKSVVLWGNHMQEGANHASHKVPWMLAGQAGGYFKTGQCLPSDGKPTNQVMTDICAAMGVPTTAFGGATMAGLKA